jgi:uncharacterized membrane protein
VAGEVKMSLPRPLDPNLGAYLELGDESATLRNPPRDFIVQGLLIVSLLPVVFFLLAALIVLSEPDALWVALGGATLLSGLCVFGGILSTALGILGANRRRVLVDADASIHLVDGRVVEAREVAEVFVGRPSSLGKWRGIGLRTHAGEKFWLLKRLPPSRWKTHQGVAAWLGEALDVPVDLSIGPQTLGFSENGLAALCYVPVQGIWLLASVAALLASKAPAVRFAARQSLAWYFLSGLALICWGATVGGFAVILADATRAREIVAVLAILLIVPPALIRIVLGLVAAWKASKGERWLIPGIRWWSGRW